jgi:hypothetical protein
MSRHLRVLANIIQMEGVLSSNLCDYKYAEFTQHWVNKENIS